MVYVLYKTDAWHSYASRDIIGVSNDKSVIINLCKQQAKKEGEELSEDDLFNLHNIKQTQGYAGEGEFHYEEIETDQLL